ncbi:hypothetical protein Kpol_340p7 [Vanderwaltozyma polyspora DSM 70294]|uniref:DNA topoisomerase n=1 Tax=Vanderwaltozyma polyspora (strain ATCC 22028 / DSM 70294 / BCRC 21397 / CBS 2163 / NBRC 10782 / NRRL Y-8283 / UCD 57-17) TaxID=436907 RepID=A7TSV2_VANPO|nr:uncharacterized protein Kpol_340p7 [Vanderwaltozyma polyspora DSM 70294]EDO14660.1 hypothetical protein Kpol_340p7 [Vanderwaltozyma polyspora DSM 70294]
MRVLCVAEKNSIAKAVSQILSGGNSNARDSGYMYVKNYDFRFNGFPFINDRDCDVTMTSVAGHLMGIDFPNDRYGWGKCPVHELFDAPLLQVYDKNQKKIADNIKKEARNADFLMIWTDCDREGEYIGWEIFQEAKKGNRRLNEDQMFRANFSHLERSHILYAARNPRRLDMNSVNAVETRMEIDLRAGVTFTRLLTDTMKNKVSATIQMNSGPNAKKENVVISYGTCQFPTLGFVVDRYERIRHFIPEEFWHIQLQIENKDKNGGEFTTFQWERGHIFDRLTVLTFYEVCLELAGNQAKVIDLKSKPTSKYRPLPLTTVELQKNCARFLRLNAKQSLDAAEKLYQKGFISYPRTETDIFPQTMNLKSLVEKQAQLDQGNHRSPWAAYAEQLISDAPGTNKFKFPRSGTHDDKAHPPIHPIISLGAKATNITPVERSVYEYVVRHFLACCSEDAKGLSTTLTLDWAGEKFTASGLVVLERNFLDVYPWAKWESTKQLPRLEMNEICTIGKAEMKSGKTSPPKPMTESELISLMDVNGIGTDATIAEHIEKIQVRKYIKSEKSGKETYLQPTTLGIALVHGFEEIGLEDSFAKPFQRREMEEELKKICEGNRTKNEVVVDIVEKYKKYWIKTNGSKNTLLEVFDRVRRTVI